MNDLELAKLIELTYKVPHIESHGVECRVDRFDQYDVVSIRGSTDRDDWITNLRFYPAYAFRIGVVSSGSYRNLKKALHSIVARLDVGKPLYISGHSKGGPEALFLARILQIKGYRVVRCVTFGAPQAVYKGSVKSFDNLQIAQYRNGGDIVNDLPSTIIPFYNHVRELTQLGDGDSDRSFDKYHYIEHYIEALSELKNDPKKEAR